MEPGRVIEFIEGRRFITAMVTRVKGPKYLVLSETDREMSVSAGRILHDASAGLNPTKPRDELVRKLKEISERRSALAESLNLSELWELLEGEGEEFAYNDLAELAWPGPRDPDREAAILRSVFADGLYFKMRPDAAERNSAEKVDQLTQARAKEEERERELAEGGEWLGRTASGGLAPDPDCRDRIVAVLRDMALHGPEAREYRWGQKLIERAGLGNDPWLPFRLLVNLGEMNLHENLALARGEVPTVFPVEVLQEAERLARSAAWRGQERRDLTNVEVITADSGGARDFDDAVSLTERDGRLVLGVHIADVSAVIEPDTLLDLEARSRATSIYMPDLRIPMLPEVLSEECLSLKENEVRPAFSLLADMTEDGEVLSYEFFPSLIKVTRQLSYQEVDASVEQDLTLSRLFRLSRRLSARRIEAGALLLPLPKLNVYLTPEGEIGVSLTHWENPGRSMISEFMILANHLAARFLCDRGAAGIYRTQDEPAQRVVPGDSDCQDLYPCLAQRKFLPRVNWNTEAKPHHGMGLSVYTNLSSPLRRFIDLIIQRQVRSAAAGGPPLYTPERMSELLTEVDATARRAAKLQMRRRRYWLLRYMEAQPSRDFEALALDRLPHRWRIFLPSLMMDADMPLPKGREILPGEAIHVRARKINAREDILKFELL